LLFPGTSLFCLEHASIQDRSCPGASSVCQRALRNPQNTSLFSLTGRLASREQVFPSRPLSLYFPSGDFLASCVLFRPSDTCILASGVPTNYKAVIAILFHISQQVTAKSPFLRLKAGCIRCCPDPSFPVELWPQNIRSDHLTKIRPSSELPSGRLSRPLRNFSTCFNASH
jgi:hypothetical protein